MRSTSVVAAVVTLTHLAGCMNAQRGMLHRPLGLLPTVTQRATEGGDGAQRAVFGASGQPVAVANPATAPSGMACAIADRVARGVVVGEVARGVPFGEVLHEQVAPSIGAVVLGAGAVASVIADGSDGALADGRAQQRSVVASMRGKSLARQQATHYKCLACAALVPNAEQVCARCGYESPVASELCPRPSASGKGRWRVRTRSAAVTSTGRRLARSSAGCEWR